MRSSFFASNCLFYDTRSARKEQGGEQRPLCPVAQQERRASRESRELDSIAHWDHAMFFDDQALSWFCDGFAEGFGLLL